MGIVSLQYLFFLTLVFLAYFLCPKRHRWCVLLAASWVFYAVCGLTYLPFLAVVTLSTWLAARVMGRIAEKAAAHMIASDGESAILTESAPNETDYACWKKIRVENLDSACNALEQLASEYEGSVTRENGVDQEITYRVELPGAYLDDFAAAVGGIGDVRDSETREGDFDPAIAYVLLFE